MFGKVKLGGGLRNIKNMNYLMTFLILFCFLGCKYQDLKLEFDPVTQLVKVMDDSWVISNVNVSVEDSNVINYILLTDSVGSSELNLKSCNDDYECQGNSNNLLKYEYCLANVYIKKNGVSQYEQQVYRYFSFRINPRDTVIQHIKLKFR